jgi:hypothetical protein
MRELNRFRLTPNDKRGQPPLSHEGRPANSAPEADDGFGDAAIAGYIHEISHGSRRSVQAPENHRPQLTPD